MPRTKLRENKDFYLHESDPVELDEVDELGFKDGTNSRVDKVHTPDVLCDHAYHDVHSVNFGVQKHQYEANNEVDEVIAMEHRVNKGRRTSDRTYTSRELMRRFNDILGDYGDE